MKKNIVLSEVPLLDDLLRLPYATKISEAASDELFKAAIRLLARKVSGNETHLFIKCDSWHTLFYERIRRCYPGVPVLLLYRSPMEIMQSNSREPGMQFVPGVIQPEIFGLDTAAVQAMTQEIYFAHVLDNYFREYLKILRADALALPVSYHDGVEAMFKSICAASGFVADEEMLAAVKERSRYHSKKPAELFSEEQIAAEEPAFLKAACESFRELNAARMLTLNQ